MSSPISSKKAPAAEKVSDKAELLRIEKTKIKSAVFTDFILSIEIVMIALGTVMEQQLLLQIIVVSLIAITRDDRRVRGCGTPGADGRYRLFPDCPRQKDARLARRRSCNGQDRCWLPHCPKLSGLWASSARLPCCWSGVESSPIIIAAVTSCRQ